MLWTLASPLLSIVRPAPGLHTSSYVRPLQPDVVSSLFPVLPGMVMNLVRACKHLANGVEG